MSSRGLTRGSKLAHAPLDPRVKPAEDTRGYQYGPFKLFDDDNLAILARFVYEMLLILFLLKQTVGIAKVICF